MANQLVRTLVKLGIGLGCGLIAEHFVSCACDREADNIISNDRFLSKGDKFVLKAGAALTGYAIGNFVGDQCGDFVDDIYTCYDGVKALTSGKQNQDDDEEDKDGNA